MIPTVEADPGAVPKALKIATLRGQTIGFLSNAKPMADVFLEEIALLLIERYDIEAVYAAKMEAGRIAPAEILADLSARCRGIVTGIGD